MEFSYLSGLKNAFFDKNSEKFFSSTTYLETNDSTRFKEELLEIDKDNNYSGNIIHGAINFNNTKVVLENVGVRNVNSEDGINIFNSNFKLKKLYFFNNLSDGIDFDFSQGSLEDLSLKDIGNDGIDFSGSDAIIKNIQLENIGDKLVSVGENSKISISGIYANDSYVGIASKDGSLVYADNVQFQNVKIPFATYNKKKEYDIPSMFIKDSQNNSFNNSIKDNSGILKLNQEVFGQVIKEIIPVIYRKDFKLLKDVL